MGGVNKSFMVCTGRTWCVQVVPGMYRCRSRSWCVEVVGGV